MLLLFLGYRSNIITENWSIFWDTAPPPGNYIRWAADADILQTYSITSGNGLIFFILSRDCRLSEI